MKIKKLLLLSSLLLAGVLTACGSSQENSINVVSREEGSGTRSAFVELTGVLEKNGDDKLDKTSEEAIIQMQTEGVIKTVENDENSIGYISTGSLSDRVKAINVDGVEPSSENIKTGAYKISRPFILVTKDSKPLTEDFLSFINSKEGQEIVGKDYIPVDTNTEYKPGDLRGTISIAGSTSISPVMEKLSESYKKLNPGINIELQQTGSSAGITSTIEGTVDLGMSSRALTSEEKSKLRETTIALDGIAVIVNKNNPVEDLSLEEIRNIFIGEILDWNNLGGK